MMKLQDYAGLLVVAFIQSALITFLIAGIGELALYNYDFSMNVCGVLDIPKDLAITPFSLGFGNNLTVVVTFFEILILSPLIKRYIDLLEKVYEIRYRFF